MKELFQLLDFLEEKIDETHLQKTIELHQAILDWKPVPRLPVRVNFNSGYAYKTIPEIHADMGCMLYNELVSCVPGILLQDDSLPMIRANYGVGSVPSLFGLKSVMVNGNMPWVEHLKNTDEIRALIQRGVPDLNQGFGAQISAVHTFYRETLRNYPKCARQIKLYHTDCQGPFDIAHLIWGSDIYMAMYDDPGLFFELMELITDTLIAFMERDLWETNAETGDCNYHWGALYKGRMVLRDDSSVNLSRDMYEEFVLPYNKKIAEHFGTISLHFCGRADQWVKTLIAAPHIDSVNFGYMEEKFDNDFLRFIQPACESEKTAVVGYCFNTEEFKDFDPAIFKTGMSIAVNTDTFAHAQALLRSYQERMNR